jgi:DUF4097 and DUF4098 domain-containing protein YvlB
MEYIRTASWEYDTGARLALAVDGRSGNVTVEGQDVDRVTVEVVAHLSEEGAEAADVVMERLRDAIRAGDGALDVRMPELGGSGPWYHFGRGPRVDYTITVPLQTAARLAGRSGRVQVTRIAGPVEIEQRSGRTNVHGIGADVSVDGRSGAVEIDDVTGSVTVGGHSGRVSVRGVTGNVLVISRSGAVDVERVGGRLEVREQSGRIAAVDIGGDAALSSQSGAITLEAGQGAARLHSTSGQVAFRGPVRGDIEVQTVSGAIRLEIDPAHPFYLDAESVSGSIRSDISPQREGAAAASGPRVRLRTVSGAIRIRRYEGSAGALL